MGMFDNVRCHMPLPKGFEALQEHVFQTKDLDCIMDEFTIQSDGTIHSRDVGKLYYTAQVSFATLNPPEMPETHWVKFCVHMLRGKVDGAVELVRHELKDKAP